MQNLNKNNKDFQIIDDLTNIPFSVMINKMMLYLSVDDDVALGG